MCSVNSGLGGEKPASCQLDLIANIGPKQQVFGRSEALVGSEVSWANDGAARRQKHWPGAGIWVVQLVRALRTPRVLWFPQRVALPRGHTRSPQSSCPVPGPHPAVGAPMTCITSARHSGRAQVPPTPAVEGGSIL